MDYVSVKVMKDDIVSYIYVSELFVINDMYTRGAKVFSAEMVNVISKTGVFLKKKHNKTIVFVRKLTNLTLVFLIEPFPLKSH